MKKIIAIVLLLSLVVVSAQKDVLKVGHVEKSQMALNSGKYDYTFHKEKEVAGFEKVFKKVERQRETCQQAMNNDTLKEETVCSMHTFFDVVEDKTAQGKPVYKKARIKSLAVKGKVYDFDQKGCWVCDKYVACLSKKDGYSEARAEKYKCRSGFPVIRGGESGWIKDLDSGEIVFSVSDVGVVR